MKTEYFASVAQLGTFATARSDEGSKKEWQQHSDRRAEQAKAELMLQQEEQLIAAFGFWVLAVKCYPF